MCYNLSFACKNLHHWNFPTIGILNRGAKFIFVPMLSLTESDDYNTTACSTQVWLNPAERTSEVNITFPADYDALEGTEILLLSLANTQTQVTSARNIFFQDTSIQIRDTTGN